MYMQGMMPGYAPAFPAGYELEDSRSNKPYYPDLVKTLQDCEAVCERMTNFIKECFDVKMRVKQLKLLRDCADICGLTAKFVARCSAFAKDIARLCACICEACAIECARYPDRESQHCARVCINCARECMAFAS